MQPGARCIRGGGSGRVAGGRADDRLDAAPNRLTDRDRHAAIFERTGWVESLELYPQLKAAAQFLCQTRHGNQRGIALEQGYRSSVCRQIEQFAISRDHTVITN